MTSEKLVRWLCWALAVLAIATAVLTVGISQRLLVTYPDLPDSMDLVDRLALFRQADVQANAVYLLSNFAGFGVFLVVAMLAAALRPFAATGSPRDVMVVVLVVGAVIGLVAELVIIGTNIAATFGYCDCGYKAEELIAQAKALDVAFSIQNWLAVGALSVVGLGVALAGALITVSSLWRWLSYGIAVALLVAAVLQVVGKGDVASLITGVSVGIGVPVWAFLLARAMQHMELSDSSAG